jgi:hypothetical protein
VDFSSAIQNPSAVGGEVYLYFDQWRGSEEKKKKSGRHTRKVLIRQRLVGDLNCEDWTDTHESLCSGTNEERTMNDLNSIVPCDSYLPHRSEVAW